MKTVLFLIFTFIKIAGIIGFVVLVAQNKAEGDKKNQKGRLGNIFLWLIAILAIITLLELLVAFLL